MRMYARITDQGTAAAETGLCGCHVGSVTVTADADVTGPYVDVTGNESVACVVCGETGGAA